MFVYFRNKIAISPFRRNEFPRLQKSRSIQSRAKETSASVRGCVFCSIALRRRRRLLEASLTSSINIASHDLLPPSLSITALRKAQSERAVSTSTARFTEFPSARARRTNQSTCVRYSSAGTPSRWTRDFERIGGLRAEETNPETYLCFLFRFSPYLRFFRLASCLYYVLRMHLRNSIKKFHTLYV